MNFQENDFEQTQILWILANLNIGSLVSCVSHAFASVHCCLVVTCWERADRLALVGDVYWFFLYFPMWYPVSDVVLDCIRS